MPDPLTDRLTPRQRDLLGEWLPDLEVDRDHSWGLTSTVVLEAWRRQLLREAVSTTVWAHQVGDVEFEAQGGRMLADALTLAESAAR